MITFSAYQWVNSLELCRHGVVIEDIIVTRSRYHIVLFFSRDSDTDVPTARDLTLDAARDASALRKTPTRALPPAQLKRLLDSRSEREVLDGLRRVISVSRRSNKICQNLFKNMLIECDR